MAANIYDWSLVAANNSNSDADLTWAEGQAPSTVNNAARVMMQREKQLLVDIGGSIAAGGTANGLTVTASSPFTAYADGMIISFRATASNSGAATLSVNGIGAKAILKMGATGDVALVANEIRNTGIYTAQYSAALNGAAGAWLLVNPTPPAGFIEIGSSTDYWGTTAPAGWLLCYGQAVSRTTYAALFAVISTVGGPGDGLTTFNIPDLRGRVIAGQDDMGGVSANRLTNPASTTGGIDGDVLGGTGGLETHSLTSPQNGPHVHTGTTATGSANHVHTVASAQDPSHAGGDAAVEGNSDGGSIPTSASGLAHTHTFTTDSGGSGTGHNNVQPTIVANVIIYAGV